MRRRPTPIRSAVQRRGLLGCTPLSPTLPRSGAREAHAPFIEGEFDASGRPVAVLAEVQVDDLGILAVLVVVAG